VILTGALVANLGLVATSYATDLWQLYLAWAITVGLGHSLCFPPCPVVVSTWFSSRTGFAIGIATTGTSVGVIYLSVVMGVLIEAFGWRKALRVLAAVSFAITFAAALACRIPGETPIGSRLFSWAKSCVLSSSSFCGPSSGDDTSANVEMAESGGSTLAKTAKSSSSGERGPLALSEGAKERKITAKGKLQVLALLCHPRFSRLCLAYFLASFTFETPFVHLVSLRGRVVPRDTHQV